MTHQAKKFIKQRMDKNYNHRCSRYNRRCYLPLNFCAWEHGTPIQIPNTNHHKSLKAHIHLHFCISDTHCSWSIRLYTSNDIVVPASSCVSNCQKELENYFLCTLYWWSVGDTRLLLGHYNVFTCEIISVARK